MVHARFVGLLVLALLCACSGRKKKEQVPELPAAPKVAAVDAGVAFGSAASGPPRAIAAALPSREIIPVDRRFVLALAHVDRIMGRAPATYDAKLGANDKWTISAGASVVASDIARIPDFRPLMDAVTKHASQGLPAPTPLRAAGPIDVPVGPAAFAALDEADQAWATQTERARAARTAATALVGILFGMLDGMDVGDDLSARGIAAMGVAKAHGVELPAVEALLARLLTYGVAAKQLAPSDDEDPAAAYAAWDDARLSKLSKKSAFGRLAWLRRLTLKQDRIAANAWVDREYPPTRWSVTVLNQTAKIDTNLEAARALERTFAPVVLLEVLASGSEATDAKVVKARAARDAKVGVDGPGDAILAALGVERKDLLVEYEKAMTKLGPKSGRFHDATLERDLYDTAMLSAMSSAWDYWGGALASPEGAAREADALVPGDGVRTKAFATWFKAMAASQSKASPVDLVKHVTASSPLGSGARWRLFRRVSGRLDEAVAREYGRAFLASMDTRPSYVFNHAVVDAYDYLLDATLHEALVRSVVERLGEPGAKSEAWLLKLDRQRDPIIAFCKVVTKPIEPRAALITWAAREGIVDDTALDEAAKSMLAEAPSDWSVHEYFINAYRAKHPERARGIAQAWLDRGAGKTNGALGDVRARIELASLLSAEKKYDAALAALKPAIATGQEGALEWGAMMHARAGRKSDAERLAQQAWERYPQSTYATITVAAVRWLANDMAGAAEALAKSPRKIVPDWRLGEKFASVFKGQPDEAAKAVEAIRGAGLKDFPVGIANYLLTNGDAPLALAAIFPQVQRGVFVADQPSPHRFDPGEKAIAVGALIATKGKPEALKWFKANTAERMERDLALYAAFEQRIDEALEVIGDEDQADRWVLRVAAELRRTGKVTSAEQARKVFKRSPEQRYSTYGSYLLGDVDAAKIEALASSPKQTCEVAFFLAVRAQAEGRHREAISLMRVALDTRSTGDGEYKWSQRNLLAYLNVLRPIDKLEPGYPKPREQEH